MLGVVLATGTVALGVASTQKNSNGHADTVNRQIQAAQDKQWAAQWKKLAAEQKANTAFVHKPSDRPLSVGVIGDSISFGSYTTVQSNRWETLVAKHLDPDAKLDVEATSGQTTQDAIKRPIPHDVDLLMVQLGSNDIARGKLSTLNRDYAALLAKAREQNPSASIICLSPWAINGTDGEALDDIRAGCKAVRGVTVPIEGLYRDDSIHAHIGDKYFAGKASDAFHPNDRGHALIAGLVLRYIVTQ